MKGATPVAIAGAAPQPVVDERGEVVVQLLLEQIDLTDALVTIDAMGCQKEITRAIVEGGGDFVIALKDNQPTLRQGQRTLKC